MQSLKGKRAKVSNLSSTHALLKKLQFLFELPTKLNTCIDEENWSLGVKFYVKAEQVLLQYEHMPSFRGIKNDCDAIMEQLKLILKQRLKDSENSSPQVMAESVHLLIQLKEPIHELCDSYLSTSKIKLQESLDDLSQQVEVASTSEMDILEFVDQACNGFMGDLCLIIGHFNDTFNTEKELIVADKLNAFVLDLMSIFMSILQTRMLLEKNLSEAALLVRAVDRFYRRVQGW